MLKSARYASSQELMTEYLEKMWSRVWAARTCAAVDASSGWLGVVLGLDESVVFPCCLRVAGGRVLLTGCEAEKQTGHKDLAAKEGKSPG